MRKLTAQVADVSQPLLAVRGMTKAGHRVVFDEEGWPQASAGVSGSSGATSGGRVLLRGPLSQEAWTFYGGADAPLA